MSKKIMTNVPCTMDNPLCLLGTTFQSYHWENKKYLLGRVLTVIDGCISDQEQRKAVKNLIEDAFYGMYSEMNETGSLVRQFGERFAPSLLPKNDDKGEISYLNGKHNTPERGWFPTNQ